MQKFLEKVMFWESILEKLLPCFLKKNFTSAHLFNKKWLRRRMTMRVSALQSSDVGGSSEYLQQFHTISKKLFRGLWSKVFTEEKPFLHVCSPQRVITLPYFFEKKPVAHVCFNKKGLRHRMTMNVSALQGFDVVGPSRHLGQPHSTSRNCFTGLWKPGSMQNWCFGIVYMKEISICF